VSLDPRPFDPKVIEDAERRTIRECGNRMRDDA
jgi:hypothetical protein